MYKLLHDKGFDLEPRGKVKVKGKGEMMTYFLEGPRPHAEPKSWLISWYESMRIKVKIPPEDSSA